MNFLQTIRIALRGIIDNKLRSFLTMLGIIIGVASVIVMVSIGQGAAVQVSERIQSLGSNLLTINIIGRGANTALSYKQAMEFAKSQHISAVAPVISAITTVKYDNKNSTDVQVIGTNSYFSTVRNFNVSKGRFFLPSDIEMRRKVAILGVQVAEDLFGFINPLGQDIKIHGQPFKVIGVLEAKGNTMMGSSDNQILIPITVAERLMRSRGVRTIYVQAAGPNEVSPALDEITSKLSKFFKNDEESFRVFDQTQVLETVEETTGTLSMMLGGIAGISLLVGGIGIMNIMLVSVTERTREIGIRKALGAKKKDILFQFLIESLVISGIGGIIGIFLGLILSLGMANFMRMSVKITVPVIWIAFSFALLVGVCFGLYPANKAASLRPIEALRYE
ncbi:MAG: ABC transporter permease [Thermoanaerobacteraceae bacterium]|nr:ABC transporter permease [Thermoanaerobacteraceae bacterium]